MIDRSLKSMPWVAILAAIATALGHVGCAGADELEADRLLDPARLLEIRIEIPARDWTALCRQAPDGSVLFGGSSQESSYTYFKADLWIGETKIESVGIRKKGFFGSNDGQRPSLKVKFDEFVQQDPVKGLSRLTLNNNKQDQSLVSQMLTYQLLRDSGVAAPRCAFARLTVNGQYLGIYTHVESIKKPFLKRSFGSSKGNLYEAQLTDFHPRALENFQVKSNESDNDLSDIKELARLLAEPGELNVDALEEILDLDYFLRFWAVESLTGFWDGYAANQNNFYLYFNPKNDKGYFIPWGADWVFTSGGPGGPGGGFGGGFGQRVTAVYAQSILTNRLYHTPGIPQRYQQTMQRILTQAWVEPKMLERIDQAEKLLTPHLHATQRGTPQAMEGVREFIRSRKAKVLAELARGPVMIPAQPRQPSHTVAVGKASGTFTAAWSAAGGPPTTGSADLNLTLDRVEVAFQEVTASVQVMAFPQFGRGGPGGPAPRAGFRGGADPRGPAGASIGPQGGPGAVFEPPVVVTLTATRPDADPMTFTFVIDRAKFKVANNPIEVRGRISEGRPGYGGGFGGIGGGGFGGGRANRLLAGSLQLTQAGSDAGDPVSGKLELEIVETRGGIFGGGGGPGPGPRPGPRPGPGGFGAGRGGFGPGQAAPASPVERVLDSNGDGILSAEEIEEAATRLLKLDRNQDGTLTPDEWSGPPPEAPSRP